ncbi:MAG: hypothetical protein JOY85_16575 [Acidobacteriaceae bacterium]|nr:hypothetical protein [Acidobacteriaceae bacterium]
MRVVPHLQTAGLPHRLAANARSDQFDGEKRLRGGRAPPFLPFIKLPCAQSALPTEGGHALATVLMLAEQPTPTLPLFFFRLPHSISVRCNVSEDKMRFTGRS